MQVNTTRTCKVGGSTYQVECTDPDVYRISSGGTVLGTIIEIPPTGNAKGYWLVGERRTRMVNWDTAVKELEAVYWRGQAQMLPFLQEKRTTRPDDPPPTTVGAVPPPAPPSLPPAAAPAPDDPPRPPVVDQAPEGWLSVTAAAKAYGLKGIAYVYNAQQAGTIAGVRVADTTAHIGWRWVFAPPPVGATDAGNLITLSPRDSRTFAEALINPPEPNTALQAAFQKIAPVTESEPDSIGISEGFTEAADEYFAGPMRAIVMAILQGQPYSRRALTTGKTATMSGVDYQLAAAQLLTAGVLIASRVGESVKPSYQLTTFCARWRIADNIAQLTVENAVHTWTIKQIMAVRQRIVGQSYAVGQVSLPFDAEAKLAQMRPAVRAAVERIEVTRKTDLDYLAEREADDLVRAPAQAARVPATFDRAQARPAQVAAADVARPPQTTLPVRPALTHVVQQLEQQLAALTDRLSATEARLARRWWHR